MNVRRSVLIQIGRLSIAGLAAILLVSLFVSSSLNRERQTNQRLTSLIATQTGELALGQNQVASLQDEIQALKERWFGTPAIWQAPPIANTDIAFFDVSGSTQQELINSLNHSSLCTSYVCLPDPAAPPNSVAWGLEGLSWPSYYCYSPSTTTLPDREYVVLPRWTPPADGTVKIPLVEKWNALALTIYTHEAGHVAITIQDLVALNNQAQQLPSCTALINFWQAPGTFDQMNANQNAYHARLRADCRPEIGCIPPGWMGW